MEHRPKKRIPDVQVLREDFTAVTVKPNLFETYILYICDHCLLPFPTYQVHKSTKDQYSDLDWVKICPWGNGL